MAKEDFTIESNLDEILKQIEEKPHKVMNEVGKAMVKEIRPMVVRRTDIPGNKFLQATLSSWARPVQGDLQIGFRNPERVSFLRNTRANFGKYKWKYDDARTNDPLKKVMVGNIDNTQEMITKALSEISKKG